MKINSIITLILFAFFCHACEKKRIDNSYCKETFEFVENEFERGNIVWAHTKLLHPVHKSYIEDKLGFYTVGLNGASKYDSCYLFIADSLFEKEVARSKQSFIDELSLLLDDKDLVTSYDGISLIIDSTEGSIDTELFNNIMYEGLKQDFFKLRCSIVVDTNGVIESCNIIRKYDQNSTELIKRKLKDKFCGFIPFYQGEKVRFRLATNYLVLCRNDSVLNIEKEKLLSLSENL